MAFVFRLCKSAACSTTRTEPGSPSDMSTATRPTLFVTGAAAGIGRAVAERFMQAGWFVGLCDVDEQGVQAMQRQWGPEKCIATHLDVPSPEGWCEALAVFERVTGGRLDGLFNNAGIAVPAPFEQALFPRHP